MSDSMESPTEDAADAVDPAGLRNALKEQGEVNSSLRAENERLRKDAAFRDAGVPEEGPGKYFRQAWDGEVDAAKIREAALADGIISNQTSDTPADPEPDPAVAAANAEELLQFERFDVAGGQPEAPPTPEGFDAELRKSSTYEEAAQKLRDAGMMPPR